MLIRRTDLAMEAHELWRGGQKTRRLAGVDSRTVFRRYLNYLIEIQEMVSSIDYETGGRPRVLYLLKR